MLDNIVKVIGISGSLRKNSINSALLTAAVSLAPESMKIEEHAINDIPFFNEDVLNKEIPEPVKVLKEVIKNADGLLIVTPEYNYSVPGVLKNTIDWLSRPVGSSPLNNKPLGIMGATSGISGTIRAQLHLRQIAVFTNMIAMNRPEILIQKAGDKFDKDGHIIDSITEEHIRKYLIAFEQWIKRVSLNN